MNYRLSLIIALTLAFNLKAQKIYYVDTPAIKLLLANSSMYQRNYSRFNIASENSKLISQNVIKKDSILYLLTCQTGIVYKVIGSTNKFSIQRIDSTVYTGFNGGQYCFFDKTLYGFGGYGFWQTNGQLRQYFFDKGEWEIVKLNKILPSNNNFSYFDNSKREFWLGQEDYINEIYNSEEYKIENEVFKLSMETLKWEKQGILNFKRTNSDLHEGIYLETQYGVLVNKGGPEFEIWNFPNNTVFQLGSLSDTLRTYLPSAMGHKKSIFYVDNEIMIYNHENSKVETKILLDPKTLIKTKKKVYEQNFNFSNSYLLKVVALVSGILIIIIILIRKGGYLKKLITKREYQFNQNEIKVENLNEVNFSNLEVSVLKLLFENSNRLQLTSAEAINKIIGSEKKSLDIQKKMRSDLLISINTKFRIINNQQLDLIEKSRKPEDKRQFEYQINPTLLEFDIKKWLKS